jgi:hypothetical protein
MRDLAFDFLETAVYCKPLSNTTAGMAHQASQAVTSLALFLERDLEVFGPSITNRIPISTVMFEGRREGMVDKGNLTPVVELVSYKASR